MKISKERTVIIGAFLFLLVSCGSKKAESTAVTTDTAAVSADTTFSITKNTVVGTTNLDSVENAVYEELEKPNLFFTRNVNEGAQSFINRAVGAYIMEGGTAEDAESYKREDALEFSWNSQKAIAGFYNYTDDNVIGHTLVSFSNNNEYQLFSTKAIEPKGTVARIASLFFANADKDADKEMILLIVWSKSNTGLTHEIYEVQVYDVPKANDPLNLIYLEEVSKALDPGTDWQESNGIDSEGNTIWEVKSKARYKTSQEVKKALQSLGY